MIDPITLFTDGGFFMYLIALSGIVHLGLSGVQMARARRGTNLVPLLWALTGAEVILGLLGTALGLILCFNAVAHVDADVKEALLLRGTMISLYTTVGGLTFATVGSLLNGVVHTWLRRVAP